MIIVVSSTNKEMSASIDSRFGRCPYFAVYDSDNGKCDFVENSAMESSQGAGIAAAQSVANLNADIVLTGNLGPKAFKVLSESGIVGYQVKETSVSEAIKRFEENELMPITVAGSSQKF